MKLRELFDLPERVNPDDFVLRLANAVDSPVVALKDYVVTDQLAKCFDEAMGLVQSALTTRESKATYLHGSFGAGKSHFMAVLYHLLQGETAARSIVKLSPVVAKHNVWTQGKKFLLVPFHMIGAESLEQKLLGGFYDHVVSRHPDQPPTGLFPSDALIDNARQLRRQMGDGAFFTALGSAASGDWGAMEGEWDEARFERACNSPGTSEERKELVAALVKGLLPAARQTAGFVSLDEGLAAMSQHAHKLGYHGVILFLDELILWLASRSSDAGFVNREAPKLVKLVEAGVGNRPVPIVSFVARQRDLSGVLGDQALGAEVRTFDETLAHFEARFSRISLEDRNLTAIVQQRILKPRSEAARLQIQQAFEKVKREPQVVQDILLTSESTIEEFQQLYPFSPALVKTLVVVSSVLQRERTALKILMQLLVENQNTMELGELVPVGSLFGALMEGQDAFSAELKAHFEKARKLWDQKLRPALLRGAGLTEETMAQVPASDARVRRFRADERIVGTLVLAALAPEAETLRALTPRRLAALNYGTIKTPIPGGEAKTVEQRCRDWAGEVGQPKITGTGADPVISLQLSGVDTTAILAAAGHEDNFGNRANKLKELLAEELEIGFQRTLSADQVATREFNWRATPRKAELQVANVWEADNATLRSDGGNWRVVIDFPFDRDFHTPEHDLSRIAEFTRAHGPTRTIVWLPCFFSGNINVELGKLVTLDHILSSDDRFRQYTGYLPPGERAEAKTVLTNQRDQLKEKLRRAVQMAYGVRNPEPGILDEALRLEKEQQFISLDKAIPVRPPVAANMSAALNELLERALDGQFPGHPRFAGDEFKPGNSIGNSLVQSAWENVSQALQEPDGRLAIDRETKKKLRPLLEPLELAQVGEQFLQVKTVWFDRFDPKEAQLPGRAATVGQVREWIDKPVPLGLPRSLENLLILTYARQASRMLTLHGAVVQEKLLDLRDDFLLERQTLPSQSEWTVVAERASHLFGLTLPPIPSPGNLQKLDEQVRALVSQYAGDLSDYASKLQATLSMLDEPHAAATRLVTAARMQTLCSAIRDTRKPVDLFSAIHNATLESSPHAMSVAFKQAKGIHAALDKIRLFTYTQLGGVTDEPRATAARGLRLQLLEALKADEHVTGLTSLISSWLDNAERLLLQVPVSVPSPGIAPAPVRPAEPPAPVPPSPAASPIRPAVVPAPPGKTVVEGQRQITGKSSWQTVVSEIERDLTEDTELEISWKIVKKLHP